MKINQEVMSNFKLLKLLILDNLVAITIYI